jgi:5,5'-dehydrodivanillate O-demethylase
MLDQDRSEMLMRVGADQPMGQLLRRYWHPIAAVSEFDDKKHTKPIRLLGEDLVIYKDLGGRYGILDRHCPHRRADLSYGYVEEHGLRCNYHGWLFGEDGTCLAQPYEDTEDPSGKLRKTIQVKNYKVQERAGLLWAYMGPDPAPLVPNWEPFHWKNGFVQIVFSEIPCNWFQCQENSIDPVHFEWMHSNWSIRQSGKTGPYSPRHLKVDFDEFDYGFTYKRIREDTDENHPLWTVGRVCLWPHALFTGGHFEWRVPVDDDTTLSVGWFFNRVPHEQEPYVQNSIPHWYSPIKDEKTGRWISSHVMNQDFIAWVGQGKMADRTGEHLGKSDKGVAMIRRRFFEDMERIERGEDPKAIIRDEKENERVMLPIVGLDAFRNGLSSKEITIAGGEERIASKKFIFQYGQPKEVKRAYEEAMGFKMEDWDTNAV